MSLSYDIKNLLVNVSENQLETHRRDKYLWIWTILLETATDEFLQGSLTEISNALRDENFSPQILVELSWKAEAIEALLGIN